MDPPYKESKINRLIENIIEKKILNKKGIIIIHRHKKDKLKITEKIKILDIRNYGISKVYFGKCNLFYRKSGKHGKCAHKLH